MPFQKIFYFFRRDLPRFFRNIWFFRNELYDFRPYDYHYNLSFFKKTLEKTVHYLEFYGIEVDGPRLKKVEKMKRAIQIMNNIINNSYIEMAEEELGEIIYRELEFVPVNTGTNLMRLVDKETQEEKEHNNKVYSRSSEIEAQEWKELWDIIHGQDIDEYLQLMKKSREKKETPNFDDWFDGSGMKSWWD